MDLQQASELIWSESRSGRFFPEALRGRLSLAEGLRVQLGVRDRKLASGGRQAGWKVGLTSERVRRRYGTDARPFGHIMAADVYPSGATVPLARFPHAAIEPELCFTIGTTLRGPGVTPAQARAAVSAAGAAFELNQNRAQGVADFPLNVADNLSQWGLVTGETLAPPPAGFDFSRVSMECRRDGAVVAQALGDAGHIDDHFLSLSILANMLAEHGEALEAGMRVITGSFSKHDVTAAGAWRARFSGVGEVSVRFE
ncbi:2-keto-4-pentenoate hydratase [Sulfurifustis variabilis]|uniref:2-keto-4-pentenoate hydratase n=1 Tax=Sulfurifustis variabilis TaxID=1675686 RepID=A0A1B4V6E8_9GAMM|nr:4-oxalocrotonate decarboxylase [Sulfurifustis variabilis]BAU49088.1 2-keto-4-pentenoate hydratase [Sulfurifustis variabilis]